MSKRQLPKGIWDKPAKKDMEAYHAFVAAYFKEEQPIEEVTFGALASYYDETPTGGVLCGGCSQWFVEESDTYTTTLTLPCSSDGYLDTTTSDFNSTSSTVRIGTDAGVSFYQSWFSFCGANIPQGATITDAYLTFTESNFGTTGHTNFNYCCEDADNPMPPTSNADGQARVRTTASDKQLVSSYYWDVEHKQHRSTNLIDQVQEVVDRAGFKSDRITFWLDYTSGDEFGSPAYVTVQSTEGRRAAILTITYTTETLTELNLTPDGDGYWNSSPDFGNADSRLSYQRTAWDAFFHFGAVALPQGATIFMVNLEVSAVWSDGSVGDGDLFFCDEDNSVEIISQVDGESRALTVGTHLLDVDGMAISEPRKDTNAKASLQEVVDRTGFASGNDLQIVVNTSAPAPAQQATINSTDAASNKPNLRIMWAKFPFTEYPEGGVVGGGSSLPQGISTASSSGGSLLGGVAHVSKNMTDVPTSGVLLNGTSPSIWEVSTLGGSVKVGGLCPPSYTANLSVSGGVKFGGSLHIESGYITSGGLIVGGGSTPTGSQSGNASGGMVAGGSATMNGVANLFGSGGVLIKQSRYANGFRHKITVTVPSGTVASYLVFPLAVRLTALAIDDIFQVEDSNQVIQSHEVRETTETTTALFFRCELMPDSDNVFDVYFNGVSI